MRVAAAPRAARLYHYEANAFLLTPAPLSQAINGETSSPRADQEDGEREEAGCIAALADLQKGHAGA